MCSSLRLRGIRSPQPFSSKFLSSLGRGNISSEESKKRSHLAARKERLSASTASSSVESLLTRIQQLIDHSSDGLSIESLEQAHELVFSADNIIVHATEALGPAQIIVLDAWLHYFDKLTQQQTEENGPSRASLSDMRHAIEKAQAALQVLVPSLQHNSLVMSEFLLLQTSAADNWEDLSLESSQQQQHHHSQKQQDIRLTQRCQELLRSWAKLVHIGRNQPQGKLLRGIPQRTQYIVQQMESTMTSNSTLKVRPTVECYNAVLEAWAYSQEHLRGNTAEQIFQKIHRPNGESYRLVLRAWAKSQDRRAAFHATGHLMKMLRKLEKGDEDFEPSKDDYHVVLQSWETAEDKTSPSKALSVLKLMDYAYSKDMTAIQPDLVCYRSVLKTASHRPNLPDLGRLVDDVLTQMKERYILPDTDSYGAAIRTWRNAALHPDNWEHREKAARRCLELLSEMNTTHNQSTMLDVRMSTTNVNDVLEALSMSTHPKRTNQAEQLLDILEQAMEQDSASTLRPNADSYRLAINVWSTTNAADKIPRALALLWRMKDKYDQLRPASRLQEMIEVFNSFVRVCGSVRSQGETAELYVFKEALASIESMKALDGLKPNASTYAALLEAGNSLLSLGSHRQRVVEEVFRLCCEDGMVDDHVLRQFRLVCTPEQYAKLVIAKSVDVEGTKMVPETWTANVLGGRVVTADGRRTTPLSIDGELTRTIAMKEFQMRRLRDKRNRNFLQGGRLTNASAARDKVA